MFFPCMDFISLNQGQAAKTGLSHASLEAILNRCWHSQLDMATLSRSQRGLLWQCRHPTLPPGNADPVQQDISKLCVCESVSVYKPALCVIQASVKRYQ